MLAKLLTTGRVLFTTMQQSLTKSVTLYFEMIVVAALSFYVTVSIVDISRLYWDGAFRFAALLELLLYFIVLLLLYITREHVFPVHVLFILAYIFLFLGLFTAPFSSAVLYMLLLFISIFAQFRFTMRHDLLSLQQMCADYTDFVHQYTVNIQRQPPSLSGVVLRSSNDVDPT